MKIYTIQNVLLSLLLKIWIIINLDYITIFFYNNNFKTNNFFQTLYSHNSLSLYLTVLLLLCFLIKNNNESIFCISLKKWNVYDVFKQNRQLSFLLQHDNRIVKSKLKASEARGL